MISIVEYKLEHQAGIDQMMEGIAKEFEVPITSPQSTRINEVYHLSDLKFWVAMDGQRIAGTIGLELYANGAAVVKRMMADKEYRGGAHGTARLLLEKTFEWAKEKNVNTIYLGTMEQFKAAQKFYVKQGFAEIALQDLPSDYNSNPIDSIFYKRCLDD